MTQIIWSTPSIKDMAFLSQTQEKLSRVSLFLLHMIGMESHFHDFQKVAFNKMSRRLLQIVTVQIEAFLINYH